MTRGLFAQLAEVIAAGGIGQHNVGHGFAQRAVFDVQFQVHLGLAFELGDGVGEGLAVGADGLAQRIVGIEYSAEFKGQHGGLAEA